jgi:hypothetical protein
VYFSLKIRLFPPECFLTVYGRYFWEGLLTKGVTTTRNLTCERVSIWWILLPAQTVIQCSVAQWSEGIAWQVYFLWLTNALKPAIVTDYNRHMDYVDKGDRMANSYSISRRTWKVTKTVFPTPRHENFEQPHSPESCGSNLSHRLPTDTGEKYGRFSRTAATPTATCRQALSFGNNNWSPWRQHWPHLTRGWIVLCVMPIRKTGAEFKWSAKNVMLDYVYLAVSNITTQGHSSR